MGLVVLLLALALVFGGVGLAAEGLKSLLIIGLILLPASALTGLRARYDQREDQRHGRTIEYKLGNLLDHAGR